MFAGKLALQIMFVTANLDRGAEMAEIAHRLRPDEVQFNTPLRPSAVSPLSANAMDQVETAFGGLPAINVYRAAHPEVVTLNDTETRRRRPAEGRHRRRQGCRGCREGR